MKTIKSIITTELLAFLPISGFAYDFTVDGIYYNVVSLEDLTCAVTYGDEKYAGDVEIPATVTYNGRTLDVIEVGAGAFSECEGLKSVKISNSIITIGSGAFLYCI